MFFQTLKLTDASFISWTPVVNSQVFGYWPIYITTTWYHQRYWCILKLGWHNFYYYTQHQPKTLFALPLLMMHFATALSVWITTLLPHQKKTAHDSFNHSHHWLMQVNHIETLYNATALASSCSCVAGIHMQWTSACISHCTTPLKLQTHAPPSEVSLLGCFPKCCSILELTVLWYAMFFWGKLDCGSSLENQELVQQNWISNV